MKLTLCKRATMMGNFVDDVHILNIYI